MDGNLASPGGVSWGVGEPGAAIALASEDSYGRPSIVEGYRMKQLAIAAAVGDRRALDPCEISTIPLN